MFLPDRNTSTTSMRIMRYTNQYGDGFVSNSPYLHVFDRLERVHHQMHEEELASSMKAIGYRLTEKVEEPLPNGKKFVELDFTL